MAKPRIFISSTFYDLRQIRLDLDKFIKDLGYECVRNEQGNIPFGKENKLEDYCYKEINNIDILVSIIGGRFGSPSIYGSQSISQTEIETALKLEKQLFLFIDKNVFAEYRTFLLNKTNKEIKYNYVDNIKIYEFIETLEALPNNNPIHTFESSDDIVSFLKEQWAGLFQRFLNEERRKREVNFLQGLENTASTLNQLIKYLTTKTDESERTISDILISDHPAFERIKFLFRIPYRIFFLTKDELSAWLKYRTYEEVDKKHWDDKQYIEWLAMENSVQSVLKVNTTLFDKDGNLKKMQKENWRDDFIKIEKTNINTSSADDLPF